jgi:4-hydroxy-tetrahydrodipicolinate synthase
MNELRGLGVAMITPFNKNKEVDVSALKRLTEHLIVGGVDYLVVLGTTGESATLTKDEKKLVLDTVLSTNNGRKPIVLGIGGNNTTEVASQMRHLDTNGLTAILSVTPYYNKPSQNGLYEHYKTLSENSKLPIILYNVPGRTGVNLLPETVSRIAFDCRNVIGIKEASGSVDQIMSVIQQTPKEFLVISGDDTLTLPLIAAGADGVISVVGNAFPKEFSDMVKNAMDNQFDEARKNHYRLLDLIHLLFAEGNPGGVKEVLDQLDICENQLRLPLVPVSDKLREKLRREMIDQGFLS